LRNFIICIISGAVAVFNAEIAIDYFEKYFTVPDYHNELTRTIACISSFMTIWMIYISMKYYSEE
jgi:hypothetical protein